MEDSCFIMKKIFELLNVNVSSYTIFDRIELLFSQKKYLNNLNKKLIYVKLTILIGHKK